MDGCYNPTASRIAADHEEVLRVFFAPSTCTRCPQRAPLPGPWTASSAYLRKTRLPLQARLSDPLAFGGLKGFQRKKCADHVVSAVLKSWLLESPWGCPYGDEYATHSYTRIDYGLRRRLPHIRMLKSAHSTSPNSIRNPRF